MGSRGRIVFEAKKQPPAQPEHEFAPLEGSHRDDDLVYKVSASLDASRRHPADRSAPVAARSNRSDRRSDISICSLPVGKRSMSFEGQALHEYCLFLADTGATHSFISKEFCDQNRIRYARYDSSARLAI